MRMKVLPIAVLAFILGLAGPIAVRAEIITVPPVTPSSSADPLPPPTVLRGFPPTPARPTPICPPGYIPSPDYGCVAPMNSDYAEGSPGYDYWPDYGFGYPGFGYGAVRFHHLHAVRSFHGAARFNRIGIGVGHIGGFGRR